MKFRLGIFVLVALAWSATHALADSRDWSLPDIQGETYRLSSSLENGPVLLVFWATWCAPCKSELTRHRDLFDSYVRKGVEVILISEDTQRTQTRVKPYVDSKGFQWPVLLDPSGEVLKRYGGTSLPFIVLLNQKGDAVQRIRGTLKDPEVLTRRIDTLLGAAGE